MPLVNDRLSDRIALVFRYPISPTQSIRGFLMEMDTYGKINLKTIFDMFIKQSQYIEDMNKAYSEPEKQDSSLKDSVDTLAVAMAKRMEKLEEKLEKLEEKLKNKQNKPVVK